MKKSEGVSQRGGEESKAEGSVRVNNKSQLSDFRCLQPNSFFSPRASRTRKETAKESYRAGEHAKRRRGGHRSRGCCGRRGSDRGRLGARIVAAMRMRGRRAIQKEEKKKRRRSRIEQHALLFSSLVFLSSSLSTFFLFLSLLILLFFFLCRSSFPLIFLCCRWRADLGLRRRKKERRRGASERVARLLRSTGGSSCLISSRMRRDCSASMGT